MTVYSFSTILTLCESQRYQFVKPSGTKQNFGFDGCRLDFTFGKGKVVPKCKISFVFILNKRPISIFFEL